MSKEQSTLLQEGEKIKSEFVKYIRYGIGRAAEVVQNHVVALFDDKAGRKVFAYPDASERFFCFDDPILQKRTEAAVAELEKKQTGEAKQHLVVYRLYEVKRRQRQTELLRKRRKAAREWLAGEGMAKAIQKRIRGKDKGREENKNGRKAESTAEREVRRKVLKEGVG